MAFQNIHINSDVQYFLKDKIGELLDFQEANKLLQNSCGIVDFFETDIDFIQCKNELSNESLAIAVEERSAYGDFQTPQYLAEKVVKKLFENGINPQVIVEPTFGKGHFILAALTVFDSIETIFGVEIYENYIWETKLLILGFYINNPKKPKTSIRLIHQSVFDVDFNVLAKQFFGKKILVLGNPPWVTNAQLSVWESDNLPQKSNFKQLNGLDAMTGKGNFDIGESITLMMIRAFQNSSGHLAFLVKNAVVKNILFDQKKEKFKISHLQKWTIDAKREFNAAVDACLLRAEFSIMPDYQCFESDFYKDTEGGTLGWVGDKFVSNVKTYKAVQQFDGLCPFEWRQGLKHDCSAIMELDRCERGFSNGKNEYVDIEEDLVYGILKSSDLKATAKDESRKYTVVTQKKVGQDTMYIRDFYPKTYQYLDTNRAFFNARKSSIYKGKPPFSIFGIGDYSFLPYKVAISGLYKTSVFTLVLPQNGKPLMLDDTCYFIGFEKLTDAVLTLAVLNHAFAQKLLASLTFSDAKRMFTKDVLMRLDIQKMIRELDYLEIKSYIESLDVSFLPFDFSDLWYEYKLSFSPKENKKQQLAFVF